MLHNLQIPFHHAINTIGLFEMAVTGRFGIYPRFNFTINLYKSTYSDCRAIHKEQYIIKNGTKRRPRHLAICFTSIILITVPSRLIQSVEENWLTSRATPVISRMDALPHQSVA